MVRLKRIYDPPSSEDGTRILVDRLWPRGIGKEKAAIDRWEKDLSPSAELRKSYCHVAELWPQFRARYRQELLSRPDELRRLLDEAKGGCLTLVCASKDVEHSNAQVLREVLDEMAGERA